MDEEIGKAAETVFYDDKHHLKRRWRARLLVCAIMLLLAFITVGLVYFHSTNYWFYSKVLAGSYAVLSIWLFWYLNRGSGNFNGASVGHQIFHWLGLLVALYLVDLFVSSGVMNSLSAGVVTLTLLALTIYLIGVYSDITFIFIGIMLAVLAYCLTYVQAYLSIIMIPVIILAAVIIFFIVHLEGRK